MNSTIPGSRKISANQIALNMSSPGLSRIISRLIGNRMAHYGHFSRSSWFRLVSSSQQEEDIFKSSFEPPPFPPIGKMSYQDAKKLNHKIFLSGTLGTGLEDVQNKSGLVCQAVLYVPTKTKSSPSAKDEIFKIELYHPLAELAAGKLKKGVKVHVEGLLRCESYRDGNGSQRLTLVVETEQVNRLMPKACALHDVTNHNFSFTDSLVR
jgi:hypothetical protein